jgi:hypothetical protein
VNIEVGKKALITTDCWFIAPNGKQYRSVFGTVKAVQSSEETLGVRTNARSTNWYVEIGCMTLAGCQIHYAIRCDAVNLDRAADYNTSGDAINEYYRPSSIFDADATSWP